MPTVDASYEDLCRLIGKHMPLDKLRDEFILYAKGEIDEIDGTNLKIDIKDTNRPDLWSAEGIAREIKFRLSPEPLPKYPMKKSGRKIIVSKEMKNIRPFIAGAVIKNINITDELLVQMIHLQDKIDETFGRKRKEVAIGIYDYDKIKNNIKYCAADPNKTKFAPLGFTKKMSLKEILKQHPKGKVYAHLINKYPKYPLLVDSKGNVLSLPPVINSNYSGKVELTTKNLFIEVTGYSQKFVNTANSILVAAFADRGGQVESVEIAYPDKKITTPDFTPKETSVDLDFVRKLSGLKLSDNQIYDLLKKSGYEIKTKGKKTKLLYPAYRQDIMHQVDVVEDVIISYGYNKIEPKIPKLPTLGSQDELELFSQKVSELIIGLGFQEILSYTLTNKDNLFKKMNLKEEPIVEIENTVSSTWSVFRNWMLPSLLDFLSKNKNKEYPQRIFEIGNTIVLDDKKPTKTRDMKKLSAVITESSVGYEQIASVLDAFLTNLGLKYKLKASKHASFIEGRTASIFADNKEIGIIGEISPAVLNNWNLEKPAVAFELDLEKIKS